MAKLRKRIYTLGSQISTVISVALVLFVMGMVAVSAWLSADASGRLRDGLVVNVVMTDAPSAEDIAYLRDILGSEPYVRSCRYVSSAEVLYEEMKYDAEALKALGENPFSPEFEVTLLPAYTNADSIARVVSRLEMIDCVDTVDTAVEAVEGMNRVLRKVSIYLGVLGVLLLAVSVVLIFNTLHLAIYARRFTIHTMKLVGAGRWFICRPFVTSGIVTGLEAGIVASLMFCGLYAYVERTGLYTSFLPGWDLVGGLCAALTIAGVLFCALASVAATVRFIGYSYDSLYTR